MDTLNLLLVLHTAQLIPMETIAEFIERQTGDAETIVQAVVGVAILAMASWNMFKRQFSTGSVIMALVVAAFVTWVAINGGIDDVAAMFNDQFGS